MQPQDDKRETKAAQCPSEHIAQRLNAQQALELLGLLRERKVVQGIGTPSRDEVLTPPTRASDAMVALGGLFDGSGMDSLLVQMSVELAGHSSGAQLFDVSIRTVKMAPGSGFENLAVAQIYPTAPNETASLDDNEFQKLISRYAN